jgi:hypothetical protein
MITWPEKYGASIRTTALPSQIDIDSVQWDYSSKTEGKKIKLLPAMDREKGVL